MEETINVPDGFRMSKVEFLPRWECVPHSVSYCKTCTPAINKIIFVDDIHNPICPECERGLKYEKVERIEKIRAII